MFPSQIKIAQLSLQHIGEDDRIAAIDEDSRSARSIKSAWDSVRLFVLSEANWSFASVTREITARAVDADWPIALDRIAFPLPAEMVRFVEIVDPDIDDEDAASLYSIEAGPNGMEIQVDPAIISTSEPLTVRYVIDSAALADPARWPPAFTKAFGFYLAYQIADALGADKKRRLLALDGYDTAIRLAKRVNTRTKSRKGNATTPWTRARSAGVARAPGT